MSHQPDAPVVITTARASRSADVHRRELRYLISMGIRTACFVLAFVTSGPLRWALVAGALVLPYIAVVVANASTSRTAPAPTPYNPSSARALPGPPPP